MAGVTRPDAVPEAKARLERFLADGAHGDMVWMATTAERRTSPLALWPDVRSVIMLGMNYGPDEDPLAILKRKDRAAISTYAKGDDYHELIKARLKEIARWLVENAGGEVKVFVDTAAVMEKPLAASAGLGWQGKHTNLVSRQFGSWLFLGSIFTTLELPADQPEPDNCGTCRACLDICPTAAFPEPYRLDARRCISYLTIEHKGPIPREFRAAMGNRIYGCDDCLAVCPWNKFAVQGREAKLAARDDLARAGARRARPPRRRAISCVVRQDLDQAHRPRPFRAQCADRHRQFRRRFARGGSRTFARRCLAAGARRRGMGAGAARPQAISKSRDPAIRRT